MQLVRHLFSYSIVVVVVVMIASGYYYRETLFPNLFQQAVESRDTGETTAEKTATESTTGQPVAADQPPERTETAREDKDLSPAVAAPATEAAVTKPAGMEPVIPEPAAASVTVPVKQTEADSQTAPARLATREAHSTTDQAPVTKMTEMAPAATRQAPGSDSASQSEQMMQAQHMAADQAAKPAMPMHDDQSAPAPEIPPAASRALQPSDRERQDFEAMMMARSAYWAGDYGASEQAYQKLIDLHPDQAELHGEVGNVYYAQGKWVQAAAAYAQVVRQLYRTGRIAQADYMLQIVTSLDRDLGKQLQREQDSTTGQQ